MTHKEKVLQLLSDGEPHSHMDGYRLGVMLHSRVADLRKDGHNIACWRSRDGYKYQLLPDCSLEEPSPNPSREATGGAWDRDGSSSEPVSPASAAELPAGSLQLFATEAAA